MTAIITILMTSTPVIHNLLNGGAASFVTPACEWDIAPIVATQKRPVHNYAVLVLNRPLSQSQNFLRNLWNDASVRVTVDGGTVQWDKFINNLPEDAQKTAKLPDMITGDFDSISNNVMNKYKKKGCKIVHTPDQDYTDFTKALVELYKYCQESKTEIEYVVALGQASGRLDQVLSNIQTLFLVRDKHLLSPNTKVYLISDDAISWLLTHGSHLIKIPKETLQSHKSWCSLVPIGESCTDVTTSGLKWDLDQQSLKFGEIVSTSNAFRNKEEVTVVCSHTLLWSMRVPHISGQSKEI
ncbi:thiamin pyrophosphokinase 1 [Hyposmocoma kahamanoa]|uniref:thiamin pyrophosphokinase 1 n=1 Tax=Hyposmocoma kahamanoa TaxID=1477025 RepID=UPI000E6D7CDA|nr:thiamin pyrophosphokinase 1 [Hyposmocoma kahamanoa]